MGNKYLNEIFEDEWDTLFGNQSIYHDIEEELLENKTFTVTIIQPSDATIEVVVNGTESHTSTFTAKWDDTYTVGFLNGVNPNNRLLNSIQGKIARDITIRSYDENTENKHQTYTITVVQSANQTIEVLHNGKVKTQTFTANKYDYYSAAVYPNAGFIAGTLNNSKGVVTSNATISATAATPIYTVVTIVQSPNQTIYVKYNGKEYTETFSAPLNSTYTKRIVANDGYTAGTITDTGNGKVVNGARVSASSATLKLYNIYIQQSANQTITVTYNSTNYTSNFTGVPYGTQLTAKIVAATGYDPGTLNATSYKVTADYTFKANSAATLKKFTLTIAATTNQTITLKYTNPGSSTVTVTSSSSAKKITVYYGATWSATIAANSAAYTVGKLSGTSGTITSNVTVSATSAVLKTYKVSVTQSANQTITLKRADTGATSTSGWSSIPYNTKITASISPAASYTAGTLNATSKNITANFTFSATAAKMITRTITVVTTKKSKNPWVKVKYTNTSNSTTTSSRLTTNGTTNFTIKYNTTFTIMADADPDYIELYQGNTFITYLHSSTSWTSGKLTSNTTYNCNGIYSPYYEDDTGCSGGGCTSGCGTGCACTSCSGGCVGGCSDGSGSDGSCF